MTEIFDRIKWRQNISANIQGPKHERNYWKSPERISWERNMDSYFWFAFYSTEETITYSQENSHKVYDRPWTQMVTPNETNKQDKTVKSEPRLLASVTCNTDKIEKKGFTRPFSLSMDEYSEIK